MFHITLETFLKHKNHEKSACCCTTHLGYTLSSLHFILNLLIFFYLDFDHAMSAQMTMKDEATSYTHNPTIIPNYTQMWRLCTNTASSIISIEQLDIGKNHSTGCYLAQPSNTRFTLSEINECTVY